MALRLKAPRPGTFAKRPLYVRTTARTIEKKNFFY